MSFTSRLHPDFLWGCPSCRRPYPSPLAAADCHPDPGETRRTVVAPLVRSAELPMWDGHPLALTGWLEADQAELTVLHRQEDDGVLRATSYRFCALRDGLEPTGTFAAVPA
jgi:hypothetical protein